MTLSIMTLSIMTLSIMILSMMSLSIRLYKTEKAQNIFYLNTWNT
jgi:hypothetical protein